MKTNIDLHTDTFIKSINEKSPSAFQLLFKLYNAKLLHFTFSYIPNKQDAEEIVQDVFIKIWKNETILTNLNGYIYTVTRNACLDFLRKKKVTLNIENNISQIEASINYNALSDDTAAFIIEKELEEAVLQAIEYLPKRCKDVFILSRIEGFKHKEISKELDISTKTIENHITKALKHMRLHLRDFLTFL